MHAHAQYACLFALLAIGCADPDPADLPAEEVVLSGCSSDDDCVGGRCVDGLPGGLCTTECSTQDECPDGTVCTDTEAPEGVCLFTCSSGDECVEWLGSGYTCDTESNLTTGSDVQVCIDA